MVLSGGTGTQQGAFAQIGNAIRSVYPDASVAPYVMVQASDARHFRSLGTSSYGFSLFSERLSFAEYSARVHGDDERIDQASLGLCADLWPAVARDLLDAS